MHRVGEGEGEVERLFWLESGDGDLKSGVRVFTVKLTIRAGFRVRMRVTVQVQIRGRAP